MLLRLGFLLTALALSIGGCSKKQTADMLAEARSYAENGNWSAASIELKNVLREDPSSGPAHLLLARILYSTGEFSGARIEAQKAIDAGQAENETIPLMARIMAAQGDFAELINKMSAKHLDNQSAIIDLSTSIGLALFKSGKLAQARETLNKVLAVDDNYPRAKLLQ